MERGGEGKGKGKGGGDHLPYFPPHWLLPQIPPCVWRFNELEHQTHNYRWLESSTNLDFEHNFGHVSVIICNKFSKSWPFSRIFTSDWPEMNSAPRSTNKILLNMSHNLWTTGTFLSCKQWWAIFVHHVTWRVFLYLVVVLGPNERERIESGWRIDWKNIFACIFRLCCREKKPVSASVFA